MKAIKSAIYSMLSEDGKISVKRCISFLFALDACFNVTYSIVKTQIINVQALCLLLLSIFLLTGVATIKDIVALKNGANIPDISDVAQKIEQERKEVTEHITIQNQTPQS